MAPVLLFFGELTDWRQPLIASNDTRRTAHLQYRVADADSGEVLSQGRAEIPAGENALLDELTVVGTRQRLYLIHWTMDGASYGNHYIAGFPPYSADQAIGWLEKIRALPEPFALEL